ncbi:uncharacterized protein Dwil_GK17401 [Drosophila willistoni]|uniref:Major facilitator superfamily (MFS) profile domain-containing protein n=1 Tax=Drosophila willistoni TaxID=7260 RepID=B4NQ80_DROWI|nr:sialin [Drosophila willistoni]EDW86305.1 uncharacterized protein Dwil_GK17401 [Drosophila willistoni]
MPPHKWTDESRDASCYYDEDTLGRTAGSSTDNEDDNEEADDEQEAFCAGDRPLIRGTAATNEDFLQTRHIFGLMGFLGFAVVYAMRVNLSVAIVAMVNQTAIPHTNNSVMDNDTCPMPPPPQNSSYKPPPEGEFIWDEATQGLVLGSFFYGYVLTQVPGGRMAEVVGGKLIYGYGVLITAIFTMLTPLAARWDLPLLVLVRILEGMGEGVTYPAMHAMLAHWIPPLERNKFAAIVYAGSNIGTVISMPLAGWLCSLDFLGGWPSAFYIFGLLGMLWFVCWMYLVYDSPSVHPRISRSEREYIKRSLRIQCNRRVNAIEAPLDHEAEEEEDGESSSDEEHEERQQDDASASTNNVPWFSLFTSVPLWAILLTQCGQSWAFYTQLTELPTYMANILHFDIQSNAILNAVPPLTAWFVGIACSALADWMLAKRYITQINSYKLWNTVASVVPSLGLIGIIYVGCDWVWVTFMLAGVGSFGGAVYAGNQMNHIALSPRYAGTMYGITNSAANICGFLAPYVVGLIINHRETLTQWHIVFWLAAGFSIAGNFIYLMFASAEEQSWSLPISSGVRRRRRRRSVRT